MSFLYAILLVLGSPFILIYLIFATITDYFKYKKTQYYKDTQEKYSWLCARSYYVVFYDAIKSAGLPVDYYRDRETKMTGYGYFIHKDILIICDYDSDILYFNKDENEWLVYDENFSAVRFSQRPQFYETVHQQNETRRGDPFGRLL